MLFQTGNMDDGCHNKGSMLTKSLFLLLLNRTGHMIFSGSKQIWVSQPGSGLDKRQATLQLCIRAEGRQTVKPAMYFEVRGMYQHRRERSMTRTLMSISSHVHGWIQKPT